MNEINLSEIRNSSSWFDIGGFLHLNFFDVKSKMTNYKIFAPLNIIFVTKDLRVGVNPQQVYKDNARNYNKIIPPRGSFLELKLSPWNGYELKWQMPLINQVRNFSGLENYYSNDKVIIERSKKNKLKAVCSENSNYMDIGSGDNVKLKVLFNSALEREEYELASVVKRNIHMYEFFDNKTTFIGYRNEIKQLK